MAGEEYSRLSLNRLHKKVFFFFLICGRWIFWWYQSDVNSWTPEQKPSLPQKKKEKKKKKKEKKPKKQTNEEEL